MFYTFITTHQRWKCYESRFSIFVNVKKQPQLPTYWKSQSSSLNTLNSRQIICELLVVFIFLTLYFQSATSSEKCDLGFAIKF